MRISIINYNLVSQDAIGQSILHQVRFFLRRGDEVRIYTVQPPEGLSDDVRQLVEVVELVSLMQRDGEDRYFALSDLYVYHYPSRYLLLESIKGLDRGAVIFYYHNVTPPELWGSAFYREPLQHSVDSVGAIASYADIVVTPSDYNREQLIEQYGCDAERVKVLPLAVPLERFSPEPPDPALLRQYKLEGRQVILFVGRMAGNKRIDLLVEALPMVKEQVPNTLLLLVGDDKSNPAHREVVAHAKERAEALGVEHDIIFTGVVEAVPPYFHLADVYATASLHEGFGVPLIEAMASGVPVVASRVTSHPWVLGEAGVLVEPDNAPALAEALISILTNDRLRGKLVQRGLARAREFSLEQYEIGWSHIVSEATAWLPEQPIPRLRSLLAQPAAQSREEKAPMPVLHHVLKKGELEQAISKLRSSADTMLRGYKVHSKLPIFGRMISWVRHNLTSHLWQPYIDPTFERQVAFNKHLSNLMEEMLRQVNQNNIEIAANSQNRIESEKFRQDGSQRLRRLERQVDLLSAQVTLMAIDKSGQVEESEMASIRQQIEELRGEIQ